MKRHVRHALALLLLPPSGLPAQGAPADFPFLPYSKQRLVLLDPGETRELTLQSGETRTIRLDSVTEHRDGPVGLMRRAEIALTVGDRSVALTCAPFTMPTEVAGLRLLADTTSGWGRIRKRVQLSVWDAADPIVDTAVFRFPLVDYRMFSHGIQAYGEPVHLGLGDADPAGGRFYHDYGFDLAGYEGETRVVCCAAGKVLGVYPDEAPYAVALETPSGLVWEYQHLDSVHPRIRAGAAVELGQEIGILGRKGGAGNFSHLHVGTFESAARFAEGAAYRRHNLYPWLVAAYESETKQGLYAVARPHIMAFAGEPVRLDGSRSLAFDHAIAAYRWDLPDGTTAAGPIAETTLESPGVYVATLWVEDDRGKRDVDFCKIRVFSRPEPEAHLPTIFMTHTPAAGVAVRQPVRFRCWLQKDPPGRLTLDFGDGTVVQDQPSYEPIVHRFTEPGIHVVTASATVDGMPITQEQKLVVDPSEVWAGADQRTPSLAHYFAWINDANEGPDEAQTLANLRFFEWLREEYGMVLDVYAFDCGTIDGRGYYGSTDSARFRASFPRGFGPVADLARSIGTRLGVWLGPDGFGATPPDAQQRHDMLVALCRDHGFGLFKLDLVCGPLSARNEPWFVRTLEDCRAHVPDLLVLNHRVPLSAAAARHTTTFLLGGIETYIDVFLSNSGTGTHHRVGALFRERIPGLARLTEDHGVCLSSCLDHWDDDLVLQAFNRGLLLAPQIYGNPWLLRDDELPKLARLFNLHRRFRDILVDGIELPASYGPKAVARGDAARRFVTLRNATWNPVRYPMRLDAEIGLRAQREVEVRQLHPTERVLGRFAPGEVVPVEVPPFRSCLLLASAVPIPELAVTGCDYEVVRDTPGAPALVKLLGPPGTSTEVRFLAGNRRYTRASLDGAPLDGLLEGEAIPVQFAGRPLRHPVHRRLAELAPCPLPEDAEALYEATCFAADSNALEVRSLLRSGPTRIPAVRAARDAFFAQPSFRGQPLWDRYLFDGDRGTSFYPAANYGTDSRIRGGALRIDFGQVIHPDAITLEAPDFHALMPQIQGNGMTAQASSDLRSWHSIPFVCDLTMEIAVPAEMGVRYLRLPGFSQRLVEVHASAGGKPLDRGEWRASNLLGMPGATDLAKAWSAKVRLDAAPPGSYLCIAVPGETGHEGAYAACRLGPELIGCPDRAVSYPCNAWEYVVQRTRGDYTYYVPVEDRMFDGELEVFVLARRECPDDLRPEVWITAPSPFVSRLLRLE